MAPQDRPSTIPATWSRFVRWLVLTSDACTEVESTLASTQARLHVNVRLCWRHRCVLKFFPWCTWHGDVMARGHVSSLKNTSWHMITTVLWPLNLNCQLMIALPSSHWLCLKPSLPVTRYMWKVCASQTFGKIILLKSLDSILYEMHWLSNFQGCTVDLL